MNNPVTVFLGMGAAAVIISIGYITLDINSPEKVKQYLETKHFHDVRVGSYNWFCAKGTPIRRNFEALNENNELVEGSICAKRLILSDSIETKKIMKNNKF